MKNIEDYKPIIGNIIANYRYIEGKDKEEYFTDSQNCSYYTFNNKDYDDHTGLIGGKNWWILWPYIPKEDEKITNENVVWFVDYSSVEQHINAEWDFEKHNIVY